MWKNIIKLQKFYPHEYRFSNIIPFSSLRPSRERPEIFTQRQKHSQTDVIEWITHNYYWLTTKTRQNMAGSQFVATQSGESICRQISFLNDFENQSIFLDINFDFFSKYFHLSIQRRSFDSAGLLYHSSSTFGPGRLPKKIISITTIEDIANNNHSNS